MKLFPLSRRVARALGILPSPVQLALSIAGGLTAIASRLSPRMLTLRLLLLVALVNGSLPGLGQTRMAHAAPSVTFAVNSTLDVPDANPGDGVCATAPRPQAVCTLRAAIMEADHTFSVAVDSILITLPAGTYTLTIQNLNGFETFANPAIGDLDITTSIPVTIRGADRLFPGATVIDGDGPVLNNRVFDINPGPNGAVPNVTIQGVTVRNGRSFVGGGIFLDRGALSLQDSVVRDNVSTGGGGAGISFGRLGTLSRRNVTVQGNSDTGGFAGGGGLAAATDTLFVGETFALTVDASRILDNSAAVGGGIFVEGATTTLRDSTIAGNTARTRGGGMAVVGGRGGLTVDRSTISGNKVSIGDGGGGGGGGIHNDGGVVTAINSTISGNRAAGDGGGILALEHGTLLGAVELRNVTIANNVANGLSGVPARGGGVTGPSITARNTLVAGNAVANGGAGPDCFAAALGPFISLGFNLIQKAADCNIGTDPTNLTGVDPRIGPLANNGGPTQTHVLLADSPALNTANFAAPGNGGNACERVDQRGVVRPQNGRCDIGAVEVAPVGVTHLAQTDSSASVGEPISLALTWTHPVRWRELDNLQLRLADEAGVALWLRFDADAGTLALVDPATGTAGSGAAPGSAVVLDTDLAALDLERSTIESSGSDGPSVTLALSLTFAPEAQGRVFELETLVTDLSGAGQGFDPVGMMTDHHAEIDAAGRGISWGANGRARPRNSFDGWAAAWSLLVRATAHLLPPTPAHA
jgi:CSLREA domain-containing protein